MLNSVEPDLKVPWNSSELNSPILSHCRLSAVPDFCVFVVAESAGAGKETQGALYAAVVVSAPGNMSTTQSWQSSVRPEPATLPECTDLISYLVAKDKEWVMLD